MIKKKNKFKADLIITSDWHLTDKQPKCRTDNFWKAQWDKIDQIFALAYEFGAPVYHAGDLFEHWKTSPYLLNQTIKHLINYSPYFWTIIGNHDMPAHNIDDMDKSGLQTLFETEIVNRVIDQIDWGGPLDYSPIKIGKRKVVFIHIMTWKGKKPWPNCTDPECYELFDWFPDCDLIVTGHNHKTFTAKKGKQILVNPGSLTRHKADQIKHKPCVFLYDAKSHKIKKHVLKYKKNVISREHLDIKKEKDKRINAFIEKLQNDWDISLSFENNLERAFKANKISKKIQQMIYTWMEEI